MGTDIENLNPHVFEKCSDRKITATEEDDNEVDPFDTREVFGNK